MAVQAITDVPNMATHSALLELVSLDGTDDLKLLL